MTIVPSTACITFPSTKTLCLNSAWLFHVHSQFTCVLPSKIESQTSIYGIQPTLVAIVILCFVGHQRHP